MIIPISGAHPVPLRLRGITTGGHRVGQGRRQPASAASATLDAPEPYGTITVAMGDAPVLRCVTPTAVIFTLNQDRWCISGLDGGLVLLLRRRSS